MRENQPRRVVSPLQLSAEGNAPQLDSQGLAAVVTTKLYRV